MITPKHTSLPIFTASEKFHHGVKMPRSIDLPEDLRSLVWLNALSIMAGTYFDLAKHYR
jgi:hypothetical protein